MRRAEPLAISTRLILTGTFTLLWAFALTRPAAASADPNLFYKYRNTQGRTVYVNDPQSVPQQYRDQIKPLDLSHISLNPQLANDLKAELDHEYDRLKKELAQKKAHKDQPCREPGEAGETATASWFTLLWERYGALVLITGLLLLLFIFTPAITRRIDPGRWTRLLMVLLPLLGTVALMTYASIKTTMILQELRDEQPPCDADPSSPYKNIRELRQTLKRIEQQRQKAYQGEPAR